MIDRKMLRSNNTRRWRIEKEKNCTYLLPDSRDTLLQKCFTSLQNNVFPRWRVSLLGNRLGGFYAERGKQWSAVYRDKRVATSCVRRAGIQRDGCNLMLKARANHRISIFVRTDDRE